MRTLVNSGINVTIGQHDIDDVLKNAGVNFVTDVVGTVGANYIGELYQAGRGRIDFATHKVLHGALGVGLGAIKGDPIAGALGGMVAETVADLVRDDVEVIAARVQERADQEGIEFGTQAYKNLAYQEVQGAMNWGRLGAAVTVMLSGHDVNIGLDVATNALENNFLPMIMGAVTAASIGYAAYEVYSAYEEGGVEAAARQLGVEIVTTTVGGVIGKGVGKVVYKYGDTICHTMKEAIDLVFTQRPGLKLALGSASNAISHAAERFNSSSVGQFVQKVEHGAQNLHTKMTNKVDSLVGSSKSSSEPMGLTLDGKWEPKGKSLMMEGGSGSSVTKSDIKSGTNEVSLELKYKEGMNQKAFDKKLMNLQNAAKEGNLQASVPHGVSKSERSSVTKSYRKALEKRINEMYKNNESARENALSKLRNSDIDHIIDLQLGGSNSSSNLRSLDSFTNQDLGRQIAQQLKDKNGNIISDIIKKLD